VDLLVRMAQNDPTARPDKLAHPYGAVELDRMLAVLRRLVHVQETILTVNQAYIASAAQSDTGRVLPPFRLQGSYRNMNRLAERIVPAMNDSELDALIDDHYAGEAQTLAAGAEENLLRLAELRGRLTAEQTARWVEVREAFLRSRDPQDPVSRAVGELGERLERALGRGRGESPVRVD
jgi:hypothetical protein